MHGSFQFVAVPPRASGRPRKQFSATVARLGLSTDGANVNAPCMPETDKDKVGCSSVWVTEVANQNGNIVAGVNTEIHQDRDPVSGAFLFMYDIQINNNLHFGIEVKKHRWATRDENGDEVVVDGPGLGGFHAKETLEIDAFDARRFRGILKAATASAITRLFSPRCPRCPSTRRQSFPRASWPSVTGSGYRRQKRRSKDRTRVSGAAI